MATVTKPKRPPPKLSPIAQIKQIEEDARDLINSTLPQNYDFEIGKTVWRIRKNPNCKTVALQFPEGLLIFSTKIGDILSTLTSVDIIILGDITYGACCIDDTTSSMLGADLLVHYGHSCLVPTSVANKIDTIYIFVTISINLDSASTSISKYVENELSSSDNSRGKIVIEGEETKPLNLCLVSTIQFAGSLAPLKSELEKQFNVDGRTRLRIEIPRSKPLSSGEILGCTAPKVVADLIVYVGDGRFHLEAMMMANPDVKAVRYDPYNKTLTSETFDHPALAKSRSTSLNKILNSPSTSRRIGLILGTLGRQGNPKPLTHIQDLLISSGYTPFTVLMSEVMPAKLELFKDVLAYVQFACPRLSIDWGDSFNVPVLTSYEATLLCQSTRETGCGGCDCKGYSHPMDYYAYESGGGHTPNFKP